MSEHMIIEKRAGVKSIKLHRPEKKNALTVGMYSELADALEDADRDPGTRAIVLLGGSGTFCSGNDIHDFIGNPPQDDNSPVFRFMRVISRTRKPIVAAIDGVAAGIGATMLLHCDLVYASSKATFVFPFVNLGLCPEAGSSLLLPLVAGYARAAELLLLGETFDAAVAREIGLVNAVLSDGDVDQYAWDQAVKLAEKPPSSVRVTKALMKSSRGELVEKTIFSESRNFRKLLASTEAQESITAFLQRRTRGSANHGKG